MVEAKVFPWKSIDLRCSSRGFLDTVREELTLSIDCRRAVRSRRVF